MEAKNYVTGTNDLIEKETGKEYTGELTPSEFDKLKVQNPDITTMVIPVDRQFTGYAVGYFKKVDRALMSAYLSMSDEIEKKAMLLNATFLTGDRRILENDIMFFSACIEADSMVSFPKGFSVTL